MKQYTINPQNTETSSQDIDIRRAEFSKQRWNRDMSFNLAKAEGITLNDAHWAVVVYLRKQYLKHGLPRHARLLAADLKLHFKTQGGNKYLHQLFTGGPVTQGSRIANLHSPANSTDMSFGTCY